MTGTVIEPPPPPEIPRRVRVSPTHGFAIALFSAIILLAAFGLPVGRPVRSGEAGDHFVERALDGHLLAIEEDVGEGAVGRAHMGDELGVDGDLASAALAHHDQSGHRDSPGTSPGP